MALMELDKKYIIENTKKIDDEYIENVEFDAANQIKIEYEKDKSNLK